MDAFKKELEILLNRYSKENASATPDFILAAYLINCLNAYEMAISGREAWFGRPVELRPPKEESDNG